MNPNLVRCDLRYSPAPQGLAVAYWSGRASGAGVVTPPPFFFFFFFFFRHGPARLLFVVYGREATRINSHHEWLISNVIACSAEHYGIYW